MPVTISYHAGCGKGSIGVAGSEFSTAAVTTVPTSADPSPRRWLRGRGNAGTGRSSAPQVPRHRDGADHQQDPSTSSDSLMTIPPPVIGIQNEVQQGRRRTRSGCPCCGPRGPTRAGPCRGRPHRWGIRCPFL